MNLDFLKNLFVKKDDKIVKVELKVKVKTSSYGLEFIQNSSSANISFVKEMEKNDKIICYPCTIEKIKII